MKEPVGLDAAAEACLRAHEALQLYGTSEMQSIMRVLLFQIGQEIARHEVKRDKQLEIAEVSVMRVMSVTH